MSVMTGTTSHYLRALTGRRCPVRVATLVLADALAPIGPKRERRRAVARAVALAAALLPCALARHRLRRDGDLNAVWDVLSRFGRPEDLDAAGIGVRAQFDRTRLDARLGGLLGDEAASIADWLASTSAIPAVELGRCVAAVAPLVLGAITRAARSASGLEPLLADFKADMLGQVEAVGADPSATGRVYRSVVDRAGRTVGLGWFAFRVRS